jgi:hypothetical protein
MRPGTGPEGQVAADTPPGCDARGERVGALEWLPAGVRAALLLDLDDPGLPAAVERVEVGARGEAGLPLVASLGLAQLGLQLGILRAHLGRAGLAPREVLLLHGEAGEVIWVLRARCDLAALQAGLARAWPVRARSVVAGTVLEARPGEFAHDVVFLDEDRLALVPAGGALALRRWLATPAPPPLGAGPAPPTPGARLAELAEAPVRGVFAGRSLARGDAAVRTLRATADALELGPG